MVLVSFKRKLKISKESSISKENLSISKESLSQI